MPYNKRKQKCKQSDGTPGNYVLSYTTKKGEKRRACHTSKKKMQGQIAAIEMEADEPAGQPMSESDLRDLIRSVLSEEIISVTRGTKNLIYDAEFEADGSISSAKQVDVEEYPELKEAIQVAQRKTTLPTGAILTYLLDKTKDGVAILQDPFPGPEAAAQILTADWAETVSWPKKGRVGQGEVSMDLAFASDPTASEPDFVSADGSGRLSVKYFGPNGQGTAKTGEANTEIPRLTNELADLLGVEFPQGSFSESAIVDAINTLLPSSPQVKRDIVTSVKEKIDEIKRVILSEHDADGIMAVSGAGFEFVPRDEIEKIVVVYIRNSGTRVEFGGPQRRASRSSIEKGLETVLSEAKKADVGNYLLKELFQSHTVEPSIGDHVENVNPGCKHFGSEGIVVRLKDLPEEAGKAACYACTNSGETWEVGDVLTKSLDQLELS